MKSFIIALSLLGTVVSAGTASANYRLPVNATPEQREYYEWYHTSINQFHSSEARKADNGQAAKQVSHGDARDASSKSVVR